MVLSYFNNHLTTERRCVCLCVGERGKGPNLVRNSSSQSRVKAYLLKRGSYMSAAHVLLNLLNELGKRDKMRDLSSILSLFRNEFNKFNNTGARMISSIYYMTINIILNPYFWRKNVRVLPYV